MITIHATRHFVRFFSFNLSGSYLESFESASLSPTVDSDLHLLVESTSDWFDITTKAGRKMIVRHLLALVRWAHAKLEDEEEEDVDQEMEDM